MTECAASVPMHQMARNRLKQCAQVSMEHDEQATDQTQEQNG